MEAEAGDNKKWWANALLVGAVVGLVALPVGALGSRLGIWPFMGGFMLLGVGVVLATIVFFLGVIAAIYANVKGMAAERNTSIIGVLISLVIIVLMGNQYLTAASVPPIHNISTDTQDPPQFDRVAALRGENANPLEYNADETAAQQQAAYPFVKPLITPVAPGEMVNRVVAVLEDLGLEVVNTDAGAGRVEATDTTFWFGFKDDVVVRVRPEGGGSVVDVRSVSRVGRSDLGKNAARIGEILNGLRAD